VNYSFQKKIISNFKRGSQYGGAPIRGINSKQRERVIVILGLNIRVCDVRRAKLYNYFFNSLLFLSFKMGKTTKVNQPFF